MNYVELIQLLADFLLIMLASLYLWPFWFGISNRIAIMQMPPEGIATAVANVSGGFSVGWIVMGAFLCGMVYNWKERRRAMLVVSALGALVYSFVWG